MYLHHHHHSHSPLPWDTHGGKHTPAVQHERAGGAQKVPRVPDDSREHRQEVLRRPAARDVPDHDGRARCQAVPSRLIRIKRSQVVSIARGRARPLDGPLCGEAGGGRQACATHRGGGLREEPKESGPSLAAERAGRQEILQVGGVKRRARRRPRMLPKPSRAGGCSNWGRRELLLERGLRRSRDKAAAAAERRHRCGGGRAAEGLEVGVVQEVVVERHRRARARRVRVVRRRRRRARAARDGVAGRVAGAPRRRHRHDVATVVQQVQRKGSPRVAADRGDRVLRVEVRAVLEHHEAQSRVAGGWREGFAVLDRPKYGQHAPHPLEAVTVATAVLAALAHSEHHTCTSPQHCDHSAASWHLIHMRHPHLHTRMAPARRAGQGMCVHVPPGQWAETSTTACVCAPIHHLRSCG